MDVEQFIEPDYDLAASEDEIEDDRQHDHLIDAISSLSGAKRPRFRQRTEISGDISELHVAAGSDKVALKELVGALADHSGHVTLKKQLNRVKETSEVLATPLSKPEHERIKRSVAYDETKKDVAKWDPVVHKNRKADHLEFPLQKPDLRLVTSDKFVKRFKVRTPLEMEVAALLAGGKDVIETKGALLTRSEERALKAMNLEEAKQRRAELQRHRALLSFKEAKAHRQKKIKSKKYHRILRKEKAKTEKRAMDELQHTDPDAYIEKLEQIDRDRMQERISLKHRGASKQMKKRAIFGKYDDTAKQQVQEMLQKSRELTQKIAMQQSDDSDEASEEEMEEDIGSQVESGSHNPWMTSVRQRNIYQKPEALVNEEALESHAQDGDSDESESSVDEKQNGPNENGLNQPEISNVEHDDRELENVECRVDVDQEEISDQRIECALEEDQKEAAEKKELSTVKRKEKRKKKNSDKQVECALEGDQKEAAEKKEVSTVKRKEKRKKKNINESETVSTENVDSVKSESKKKMKKKKKVKSDKNLNKVDIDELFDSLEKKRETAAKVEESKSMKPVQRRRTNKRRQEKEEESDDSEDLSDDSGSDVASVLEYDHSNLDQSLISSSTSRKRTLEDFEANWSDKEEEQPKQTKNASESTQVKRKKSTIREIQINPESIMTVDSELHSTSAPDFMESEADNIDTRHEQRMTIADAFADDDVINEFVAEKNKKINEQKPKCLDLTLPGWGEWGGEGLAISKRKKKKFIIKAAPAAPRKDRALGNVIICETKDTTITKHQVSELPFPYKNVHQFETTVQQPIGKTWNPETAYRKMIEPKVLTQMGTIIDPINKSETFKHLEGKKTLPDVKKNISKKSRHKKKS